MESANDDASNCKKYEVEENRRISGRIVSEITAYKGDTSRDKHETSRTPKNSYVGTSKANLHTKNKVSIFNSTFIWQGFKSVFCKIIAADLWLRL